MAGACAGSSDENGDPGVLIIAREDGLIQFDLDSKDSTMLVPAPAGTLLYDPAVSPDGARIAYTQQLQSNAEDPSLDLAFDLWIANRDGTDPRRIYERYEPSELLRFPRWLSDTELLVLIQTNRREGETFAVDFGVYRINVETGERTLAFDRAGRFGVSNGGKEAIYSTFDQQRVYQELRRVDMTSRTESAVTLEGGNFLSYDFITYSPDNSRIAFAAGDQPATFRPPARLVSRRPVVAPPREPLRHGVPADIYTMDASGRVRLEAQFGEDSPSLTWSGDGGRIYVLTVSGLYEIELQSGAKRRIGEGIFHGQLTWAPQR